MMRGTLKIILMWCYCNSLIPAAVVTAVFRLFRLASV
jgi:hypothetical protein